MLVLPSSPSETSVSSWRFHTLRVCASSLVLVLLYCSSASVNNGLDPTSQDDFETLKYSLPPGHVNLVSGITCIILGTPLPGAAHGRNATMQFRYLSNYDSSKYRYRYSCADVTFSDTADSYNGDICRNKTRPVAYDRLPFPDPEDEHDDEPPPPENYDEVHMDGPPFPSWGVALIAVGGSFLLSIVFIVVYKFVYEPRKMRKRKPVQTTPWVPPPS